MSSTFFDDLTDIYERIVDWPKRLERETPFYRTLFADDQVGSLLDVACGTGHHAAMFHEWGLHVEGADVSPAMIQRARQTFGEESGLRWRVRSFDTPWQPSPLFDAAICVGNSLALAPDQETAQAAVRQMLHAVRPGGLVLVHTVNLWSLPDGPCRWQKCHRLTRSDGDTIVFKGIHRCGSQGFVDLTFTRVSQPAEYGSQSVPFLGLTPEQVSHWMSGGGGETVRCVGNYQGVPYAPTTSSDLIIIARKLGET